MKGNANIRTIIMGVISIVIALIMLGIATDIVGTTLDSIPATANATVLVGWDDFPGAQSMLKLFPLLMLIGLVLFGGVLIWIGYSGQAMDAKGSILTTIVVIVAVIMLPLVIDTVADLMAEDLSDYTGLEPFLGLVPMLYVIGTLAITGILGFSQVRSKLPSKKSSGFSSAEE